MKTTIYMHVWLLAGASLMAHSIVLAWYTGTTDTDLLTGTQKSYTEKERATDSHGTVSTDQPFTTHQGETITHEQSMTPYQREMTSHEQEMTTKMTDMVTVTTQGREITTYVQERATSGQETTTPWGEMTTQKQEITSYEQGMTTREKEMTTDVTTDSHGTVSTDQPFTTHQGETITHEQSMTPYQREMTSHEQEMTTKMTDMVTVTTQGREITTYVQERATTGQETTTPWGEMTTQKQEITSYEQGMTTREKEMTTEVTKGLEITTYKQETPTEGHEMTTHAQDMTTHEQETTAPQHEITTSDERTTKGHSTLYQGETTIDILTTSGPPNIISTPPRDQAVLGGSSAYFTCSVTWLNREHLEWRFFVDPSDPSDYGIVIFVTGIGVQDSTKHEVDSSYTLRVKNANTYDAGFYRCGLQVRQKYHFAELTVMTKVVCATMPSTSLLVGGIAEFECSLTFRGSSPPNMTWSASLKDGVHNKTILDSGYAVYRVQKEVDVWMDNRKFYCQLSFQKGSSNLFTDSCSTSVTVQVAARNITVLHNDLREVSDVVHVQEGDTFHCYAEGKPAPSFSWVKLLESVPDSEYNGSVLAVNPDMGHGLHEYSCIASNIIGGVTYTQNKTVSFYINNVPMYVEEPPTDTLEMENSEVTLKCSVNEEAGKGWIEWWFQGNHRLYSSRYPDSVASGYDINGTYNLIIKRVSDFNSGSYECRLFPNDTRYMAELVVLKDLTCDRFLVASIPSKKKTQEIDDVINDEVALETGVSKFGWNGNTWLPRTGQYVQVTCSVSYHGNLVPRVLWHNEETGDMQSHYSQQGRSIKGDAYIVASARYHNKLFSCLVDLNNNGGIKQKGQTCSGRMSVQFLQNLRITPDSFEAYGGVLRLTVGQEILCEAEGNPQPRLAWQRVAGYGDDKIDGGVLKTTALMQRSLNIYECLAWNDDGFIEIEKRKLTHFYVN